MNREELVKIVHSLRTENDYIQTRVLVEAIQKIFVEHMRSYIDIQSLAIKLFHSQGGVIWSNITEREQSKYYKQAKNLVKDADSWIKELS